MEEAISKAAALVEALSYIRNFQGKRVVVKLGGSLMDDRNAERSVLNDVAFMAAVGIRPIIVHGGGKEINAALESAAIETKFVHGLRYTDGPTLAIAERVLCGQINTRLVETLKELNTESLGLHSLSSCVLFARRKTLRDDSGQEVDLGHVGNVESVNTAIIKVLCDSGIIPVIAPIARDLEDGKLNVNADTAAGGVAAEVGAEKLVLLSDTHGVRANLEDPESFYPSLTASQIRQFMSEGIIAKGMIPKVEACRMALQGGAAKAHIIDGRIEHSLLLEIFTQKGVGTEIIHDA
jgi:acetylglutamate kinase